MLGLSKVFRGHHSYIFADDAIEWPLERLKKNIIPLETFSQLKIAHLKGCRVFAHLVHSKSRSLSPFWQLSEKSWLAQVDYKNQNYRTLRWRVSPPRFQLKIPIRKKISNFWSHDGNFINISYHVPHPFFFFYMSNLICEFGVENFEIVWRQILTATLHVTQLQILHKFK